MRQHYEETLTAKELRTAFDQAVAHGHKNLLVLREVSADERVVEICTFAQPVNKQHEIVRMLELMNSPAEGIETALVGVYDLTRNFEAQAARSGAEQIQDVLTHDTRAALAAFEEENARQRQVYVWKQLPWYKRLFSPKPQ